MKKDFFVCFDASGNLLDPLLTLIKALEEFNALCNFRQVNEDKCAKKDLLLI